MDNAERGALRATMSSPGWMIVEDQAKQTIERHKAALLQCPLEQVELHRAMIGEITSFFAYLHELGEEQ